MFSVSVRISLTITDQNGGDLLLAHLQRLPQWAVTASTQRVHGGAPLTQRVYHRRQVARDGQLQARLVILRPGKVKGRQLCIVVII